METLTAVLGFFGTLVGAFSGILISNKLVNYRIEQLERKVEKHNNLIERMSVVEGKIKVITCELDELRKN